MIVLLFGFAQSHAQIGDFLKRKGNEIVQKGKAKAEGKTDQKIDEGLDKIVNAPEIAAKKAIEKRKAKRAGGHSNQEEPSRPSEIDNNQVPQAGNDPAPTTFSNTGDFVPGKEVIAFDDFMQDNPGDLPAKWSSSGTCEIAQLKGASSHWVQMTGNEVFFMPQYVANMPANCTIEFDMVVRYNTASTWFQNYYIEFISTNQKQFKYSTLKYRAGMSGLSLILVPKEGEVIAYNSLNGADGGIENTVKSSVLKKQQKIRVSIMRQQQRVKMYFDGKKVIDLSDGLPEANNYFLRFMSRIQDQGDAEVAKLYISNLRFAKTGADTRSKLLTEGKLVTNAILFDVNKAEIKPGSEAILEEVGTALQQNGNIRIRITGHTDSDGGPEKNLKLSRDRADAVKVYLVNKYGLNEDNIVTAGKGQSEPVADNKTAAGRAQNRRVEFTKL